MKQQFYKNMALWVVILVMILLLVTMLRETQVTPPDLPFSEFVNRVDSGEVEKVTIEDGHIIGTFTSGEPFASYAPVVTEGLLDRLHKNRVQYDARPKAEAGFCLTLDRSKVKPGRYLLTAVVHDPTDWVQRDVRRLLWDWRSWVV